MIGKAALIDDRFDHAAALERCASGDQQGLCLLYKHEAGPMRVCAVAFLKRRELAEEAVQDTFVRLWSSADAFDINKDLNGKAWIYTILRNRCRDILRRGSREEGRDADFFRDQHDDRPNPEAAAVRKCEMDRLDRCIRGLEPHYRDSLLLAYAAGLKREEIALVLGVPLGTAKTWIRRATVLVKNQMIG